MPGDLPNFLESLPEAMGHLSWRLIVADNGTSEDTLEIAVASAPDATVIEIGRNAGYAAGINVGLLQASAGKAVVVVNPDVRFDPGCIETLAGELAEPTVGIAAPKLRDATGQLAFSLRRDATVRRALGEALLGGGRAGRFDALGDVLTNPESYRTSRDVDWASGALTGLCGRGWCAWDESFWLYSEETEYCLRERATGERGPKGFGSNRPIRAAP